MDGRSLCEAVTKYEKYMYNFDWMLRNEPDTDDEDADWMDDLEWTKDELRALARDATRALAKQLNSTRPPTDAAVPLEVIVANGKRIVVHGLSDETTDTDTDTDDESDVHTVCLFLFPWTHEDEVASDDDAFDSYVRANITGHILECIHLDMDEFEVVRRIKQNNPNAHIEFGDWQSCI